MSFDGRRDGWRIPLSRAKISDFVFSKLNGSGLRSLLLSDYRLLWLKDWFLLLLFIYFFRRGPVVRVDSAGPSTGSMLLSPDKRRLVWDIGKWCRLRHYFIVGVNWLKYHNLQVEKLSWASTAIRINSLLCTDIHRQCIKRLNVYLIWRKKWQF